MLTAAELQTPDPRLLNQGDVFRDVAFTFSDVNLPFVERRNVTEESTAFFPADRSEIALIRVFSTEAIVLSYDCEIDRVLRRIKKQKQYQVSDVATAAAVYPISLFAKSAQNEIRMEKSARYLLIEPSTVYVERVVDFSSMQPIPMERLLRGARNRSHGLTDGGRFNLISAFAFHLGDDKRRKGADPADPTLLEAALAALTL